MFVRKEFYIIFFVALSPTYCFGWQRLKRFSGNPELPGCADFYTEAHFNGLRTFIQNGISNYSTKNRNRTTTALSPGAWNGHTVHSFKVKKGCTLQMCSEENLGGKCAWFSKNRYHLLPTEFPGNILSLSCTCNAECGGSSKCDQIRLKKNECGRAFFEPGCNSCAKEYMEFQHGNVTDVNEEYRGQLFIISYSYLFINIGCSVKLYEFENLDSELAASLSSGTYDLTKWYRIVGSYECSCNASTPRRDEEQQMNDTDTNITMLDITNTTTVKDIKSMIGVQGRHTGLIAALRSLNSNRSPKNAYILFMGMSGSGKSTTIDTVFNNLRKTAHAPEFQATSSVLHEYRINVPVTELGLQNSELRIIDSLPLGLDLENDARVLATLDNYFENHEELSQRTPNIVLIFARFEDNRLRGGNTNFAKTLRSLDLLKHRLFDRQFSNIIIVLTHFMNGMKKDRRFPKRKIDGFKSAVNNYSSFGKRVTVVLAENDPEEWNDDLPVVNGYLKLTNGDFYPRNLFDKMQEVCKLGDDPIGASVIGSGFSGYNSTSTTVISTNLVVMNDSKVIHFLSQLAPGCTFVREETEVLKALRNAYDGWTNVMKRDFSTDLHYTQKIFSIRRIDKYSDVPRTPKAVAQFFNEIRLSPGVIDLLRSALNLTAPRLETDLLVGQGYSAIKGAVLIASPFISRSNQMSRIIGYSLPDTLNCEMKNDVKYFFHVFGSGTGYIQAHLTRLNVGDDDAAVVNKPISQSQLKLALNASELNSSQTVLTVVREQRHFQLNLEDKPELNPEFVLSVNNLTAFNATNGQSVTEWQDFFEKYGTHVVKTAFGGGGLQIKITSNKNSSEADLEETLIKVTQFVDDVVNGLSPEFDVSGRSGISHSFATDNDNQMFSLLQNGANAVISQITAWKESIQVKPVMLENELSVLPIYEIVKRINRQKAEETVKAAKAIYNISLLSYNKPNNARIPAPRNETSVGNILSTFGIGKILTQMFQSS